jgi:catechol 2,3-dioxygenase-like lactoylglutathione lyase family enzyme
MDLKLEVVPIPVADVDAAKAFYTEQVGFRLDHDIRPSEGMGVVQMTPPGSRFLFFEDPPPARRPPAYEAVVLDYIANPSASSLVATATEWPWAP